MEKNVHTHRHEHKSHQRVEHASELRGKRAADAFARYLVSKWVATILRIQRVCEARMPTKDINICIPAAAANSSERRASSEYLRSLTNASLRGSTFTWRAHVIVDEFPSSQHEDGDGKMRRDVMSIILYIL